MKSFELTNYQLAALQSKKKVYSTMYSFLDRTYFKLVPGSLTFAMIGHNGLIKTTIDVDYKDEPYCFGVDYKKLDVILQKFAVHETVKFDITDSYMTISTPVTSDSIKIQINVLDNTDKSSVDIDTGIENIVSSRINPNHTLYVSDELTENIGLFNYVFNTTGSINAIGLTRDSIMYSDRNVVIKSTLVDQLPDGLFDSVSEDDPYIYLHVDMLKTMLLLSQYKNEFRFDADYDIVNWSDDTTNLIFSNNNKTVMLPTEEQYESIRPQNRDVKFSISIQKLKESLSFFDGIYAESSWKPITFKTETGKNIVLEYKHMSTEAEKEIDEVTSDFTGSFTVDSDTLKKIVTKVTDFVDDDSSIVFNYDEATNEDPSLGVFIQIGDNFEAVISKLVED